jgi:hypothetical protein
MNVIDPANGPADPPKADARITTGTVIGFFYGFGAPLKY